MKATVSSLGVLILAVLFQGMAIAAPATKTLVLFSGLIGPFTAPIPLNVSACAQIRVTASSPRSTSLDTAAVFLWDDSAPITDLLAAPLVIDLGVGGSYSTALLETPGLTLTLGGYGSPTVVVYCR